MSTYLTALLLVIPAASVAALSFGFAGSPQPTPIAAPGDAVRTPAFPNSTCPIMGKPISTRLFTDTDRGRIWVCCKGCIAEIHEDVALAYKTAYPTERTIEAKQCPITGRELGVDSPWVSLQGLRFRVFDAAAAKLAVLESQPVLARVMEPALVDVANALCPIDGKPIDPQSFAVIDGRIVRLSSAKHLEEVKQSPAAVLERALAQGPRLR